MPKFGIFSVGVSHIVPRVEGNRDSVRPEVNVRCATREAESLDVDGVLVHQVDVTLHVVLGVLEGAKELGIASTTTCCRSRFVGSGSWLGRTWGAVGGSGRAIGGFRGTIGRLRLGSRRRTAIRRPGRTIGGLRLSIGRLRPLVGRFWA